MRPEDYPERAITVPAEFRRFRTVAYAYQRGAHDQLHGQPMARRAIGSSHCYEFIHAVEELQAYTTGYHAASMGAVKFRRLTPAEWHSYVDVQFWNLRSV